jgi:hypothetical protein
MKTILFSLLFFSFAASAQTPDVKTGQWEFNGGKIIRTERLEIYQGPKGSDTCTIAWINDRNYRITGKDGVAVVKIYEVFADGSYSAKVTMNRNTVWIKAKRNFSHN